MSFLFVLRMLGSRLTIPGPSDNDEGVRSFLEKRPARFTGTLKDNAPSVYPWWNPLDIKPPPRPAKM